MTLGRKNGWRALSRLRVSLALPIVLAGLGLVVLVRASRDGDDPSQQRASSSHEGGSKSSRHAGAETCAWDMAVPDPARGSRIEARAPRGPEAACARIEGTPTDAPNRECVSAALVVEPPPRAHPPDTIHAPRGPPA